MEVFVLNIQQYVLVTGSIIETIICQGPSGSNTIIISGGGGWLLLLCYNNPVIALLLQ